MQKREPLTAFLFLAPAFLVVGVFGVLPIFYSVFLSLFRWSLKPGPFLGLGNYEELFGSLGSLGMAVALAVVLVLGFRGSRSSRGPLRWTSRALAATALAGLFVLLGASWAAGDSDFLRSLAVTFWFAVGTVPFQMLFGLLLALGLDAKFRGKQTFRSVFLVPYIVPVVASAGVFDLLFSLRPESMANQILHFFGSAPAQWLREPRGLAQLAGFSVPADPWLAVWTTGPSLALVCLLLFNIWIYSGYYALIFSNGLAAIPREVYEAARLDGVGRGRLFFRVILPFLSPTSYFLALLGVISTFKAFTSIYVLRDPAVGAATDPTSVYVFFTFFRNLRYGYAAAQAVVLFLIVLGLTLVQRRLLGRRVFYG